MRTILLSSLIALACAAEGPNLLTNPDMSAGTGAPDGWSKTWAATGAIAAVRDTAVSRSAPASLRVESTGGAAKGAVSQRLTDLAGKTIHVTGWVRGDGVAGLNVGVGSFDDTWKQLGWTTVHSLASAAPAEWVQVDKTFAIPAGTVNVNVCAGLVGDGKAWFDDLSVTVVQ